MKFPLTSKLKTLKPGETFSHFLTQQHVSQIKKLHKFFNMVEEDSLGWIFLPCIAVILWENLNILKKNRR
jgi:hypothetical protein